MKPGKCLLSGSAILISTVHVVPLYITLMHSLKTRADHSSYWSPPLNVRFENYAEAFTEGNLPVGLANTAIIAVASVAIIVMLGSMAGYPLARNKSLLNVIVRNFILSIMMIPALSLLVPLYSLLVRFKATSTFWGIIPIHVTFNLPLSIFLYSNFIAAIPKELDEAAVLDGCEEYRIFYRIILPLLKPVTVTVIILAGTAVWNDYQFSLYFMQKPSMRVLTLTVSSFFAVSGSNPNMAAAAAVTAVLPVTVFYLFLQKYFVRGMVESAIK